MPPKAENENEEHGIFFESSDKINDSTEILEVIAAAAEGSVYHFIQSGSLYPFRCLLETM